MMQHTREYNGVFRPAFVTRWSSFVDIGVDKRYELGTWTTKEKRWRATTRLYSSCEEIPKRRGR